MHCVFKIIQLVACKNVQYNTTQHYTGHLSSLHLGYVLTYRLLHVSADTAIITDQHVSPNMII